jgi:hypothetical protein
MPVQTSTPKKHRKLKEKPRATYQDVNEGSWHGSATTTRRWFDTQNVVFGGEGWPPSFTTLVVEMREFLFNETGFKAGLGCAGCEHAQKVFLSKIQNSRKRYLFWVRICYDKNIVWLYNLGFTFTTTVP